MTRIGPAVRAASIEGPPDKRRREIESRFHRDGEAACRAYFHFNPRGLRQWLEYRPRLIRRAVEFNLLSWPRRIACDVRGRDVLDVGCGAGFMAVGYVVTGARSYTGVDPKLDLDGDRAKHPRTRRWTSFGTTPRKLMRTFRRVRFLAGPMEDVAPQALFDVAVLHNVTEHLMNIEQVFEMVRARLRTGGMLIFNHHNFYCWNGHHQRPKFVDHIDRDDPVQRKFVDWNHLSYEPGPDEYVATKLNRIRLDDLRALTEKGFEIETWDETPSDERRGGGRLTDEIRRRHPQRTVRELTTQGVFCRARRRD